MWPVAFSRPRMNSTVASKSPAGATATGTVTRSRRRRGRRPVVLLGDHQAGTGRSRRGSVSAPAVQLDAGEQVVLDRVAPLARRDRPTSDLARIQSSQGYTSASSSSESPNQNAAVGSTCVAWASNDSGPGPDEVADVDVRRHAMVGVGPLEPLLVERRLAPVVQQALVDGDQAAPAPGRVVQLPTAGTARPARDTRPDRRHGRTPAPRCRARADGRGAGTPAARRCR